MLEDDAAVVLLALLDDLLERVRALVADVPAEQLERTVPATGGRTVRDHLAQLAELTRPELVDERRAATVLADAVTHEHDLRAVLDRPGFRDDPSVLVALDVLSGDLDARVSAAGLPALRVTVEQWGTVVGNGPAVRCLVADRFELVRGMAGRRSAAQIERWNWDAPPGRYVEVISGAGPLPDTDVRERDPRVPEHLQDLDLTH
ncbi:MAG: hypothetical protein ABR549_00775 [Mycobacteriales bacterium]